MPTNLQLALSFCSFWVRNKTPYA